MTVHPPSSTSPRISLVFQTELRRKLLHVLGLAIPASVVWVGKPPVLFVLGVGSILAVIGQVLQVRSLWFNRLIERIFGSMMRPRELADVGDSVTLNGATWMVISAFLTFLCFPEDIAIAAFSITVVGDTAAALIGRRYGRHFIGSGAKTLEGSAAFLVSGLLVAAAVPGVSFVVAAAGAVGAAFAEAYSTAINDNLLAPFMSGPIMLILQVLSW